MGNSLFSSYCITTVYTAVFVMYIQICIKPQHYSKLKIVLMFNEFLSFFTWGTRFLLRTLSWICWLIDWLIEVAFWQKNTLFSMTQSTLVHLWRADHLTPISSFLFLLSHSASLWLGEVTLNLISVSCPPPALFLSHTDPVCKWPLPFDLPGARLTRTATHQSVHQLCGHEQQGVTKSIDQSWFCALTHTHTHIYTDTIPHSSGC